MLDIDAADITRCDGYTSPILVADIVELAVADLLFGANLTEISRVIG